MPPPSRTIALINVAHFADHYMLLIFPTAVLTIGPAFGDDYGARIAIATGSFLAFGALSLPAGWLGDRWSRRHMMALFFFGAGASLVGASLAPNIFWLVVALSGVGIFGAIYHPVGMAMLVAVAGARGRTFGWNGVFGNMGVALAAVTTGAIAQWFGWRWAFALPGAACLVAGVAYLALIPAGTGESHGRKKADGAIVLVNRSTLKLVAAVLAVTVIAGGFTFNTATIVLPALVVERLPALLEAPAVAGLLATAIFMVGAMTQVSIGWAIDRMPIGRLFVGLALAQIAGFAGVIVLGGGWSLVAAAFILAAVFGQVVVNDMLVARNVPDAWRARAFATRYVLGFTASASVVPLVAWLHQPDDGLTPVFMAMIGFAIAVAIAATVYVVASARQQPVPAAAE